MKKKKQKQKLKRLAERVEELAEQNEILRLSSNAAHERLDKFDSAAIEATALTESLIAAFGNQDPATSETTETTETTGENT